MRLNVLTKVFLDRQQEEHHRAPSILESLSVGMVSQFPHDYLHLICLGDTKKMLLHWTKGNKGIRMNPTQIQTVSNSLTSLAPNILKDFSRKPRSLSEIDRWKGTEFRTFLLYVGPIVLQNNLPLDKYIQFLSPHVAVRILVSRKLHIELNEYAQKLYILFPIMVLFMVKSMLVIICTT